MPGDQHNLSDYQWLVGEAAAGVLADVAASASSLPRIAASLRRDWSAERVHLLLEQVELRRRAAAKFPQATQLFFTRVGLEQATDHWVAAYKASRFAPGTGVADLCCGIGGDLMAMGAAGRRANGVDASPAIVCLAEANARVLGHETVRLATARAEEFPLDAFDAWHIDPDRRPNGRRTTRLEYHSPDAGCLDRLHAACPHAAIKLAPAAEPPEAWRADRELEWISRGGECKQLVVWSGGLASAAGRRRATLLNSRGEALGTLVGRAEAPAPLCEDLGESIYEPDAAVFAAGLDGELARQYDLARISSASGYLTGAAGRGEPLLSEFAITEVLPMREKAVGSWLRQRQIGRLEIKCRGATIDPAQLRKRLKLAGDEVATLIVTRQANRVIACVTKRRPSG